jgi:hypothetical protein
MRLRVGYSPAYGLDYVALLSAHQPAPRDHQPAEHGDGSQVGQEAADVDSDSRDDKGTGDGDQEEDLAPHGILQGRQDPASGQVSIHTLSV